MRTTTSTATGLLCLYCTQLTPYPPVLSECTVEYAAGLATGWGWGWEGNLLCTVVSVTKRLCALKDILLHAHH